MKEKLIKLLIGIGVLLIDLTFIYIMISQAIADFTEPYMDKDKGIVLMVYCVAVQLIFGGIYVAIKNNKI